MSGPVRDRLGSNTPPDVSRHHPRSRSATYYTTPRRRAPGADAGVAACAFARPVEAFLPLQGGIEGHSRRDPTGSEAEKPLHVSPTSRLNERDVHGLVGGWRPARWVAGSKSQCGAFDKLMGKIHRPRPANASQVVDVRAVIVCPATFVRSFAMSSVVMSLRSRDHWTNGLTLNNRGVRWVTSAMYSTRFATLLNGTVCWLTTSSRRRRSRRSRRRGAIRR